MFINRKKDLVSVVIPAYNHEKFIGETLDSVLNQSHSHLEVIVIDDGSTDATGAIVKNYRDPRVVYVYQDNQDAFNTLNRCFKMAKGNFISVLNSDDKYHPDRLQRLIEIQKKRKAACIFTDIQAISEVGDEFVDPNFWWNQWHQKNRRFYFECNDLYTAFLKGNFMVTTSNLFIKAEAAKKVGEFCSLRYLHDYDYIFRMMLAFPKNVVYLDQEKLLYYRLHGKNTLSDAAIIGREQDKMVIRKYLLQQIPSHLKHLVTTGTDRLVELEQELFEARAQLRNKKSNPE